MIKLFSSRKKFLGFLIIVISVISFLSLYTTTMKIAEPFHIQCEAVNPNTGCTVLGHIPYESYLGLGSLTLLGAAGVYMIFRDETTTRASKKLEKNIKDSLKNLASEEKTIYDSVRNSDGFIFQNDLIQKTGFSKVKVSRLLDRLEAKNLVERRRRGMSNVVVLKHGD